jgi:hypothetical protein
MPDVPPRWYEIQLARIVVPPEVVYRALAHQTVLLNIRTGKYHGVDEIGARFFEAVRDAPNLTAACDVLAHEYGQPIERIRADVVAFLGEMEERGLLRLESSLGADEN